MFIPKLLSKMKTINDLMDTIEEYKCLNHKEYSECKYCDGFGRYEKGDCKYYTSKNLERLKNEK